MTDDPSVRKQLGAGPRGSGPAGPGDPRDADHGEEASSGGGVPPAPGDVRQTPTGARPGAAVQFGIGPGGPPGLVRSARRDERIERLRTWLDEYGTALESGDLEALERLFAVQTRFQPGPFATLLRGRRSIRRYWEGVLPARSGLAIAAEVLGAGATHGIAHWRLTWRNAGGREQIADGVLIAAFDPIGRCTSLREWTIDAPS